MYIVNPFYTIFNENNWFFDKENKTFFYSDLNGTINNVYIDIPFKANDLTYNVKLNSFFTKFCNLLLTKVDNPKHKKNTYKVIDNTNIIFPIIIKFEPIVVSEYAIELIFKTITHP